MHISMQFLRGKGGWVKRDFGGLGKGGSNLEEQKKEFAYWYFVLRDPNLAAQKAGVEKGVLLMNDREVQREVRRLRRNLGKESAGEIAKLGLTRLLFGQAACDEEGKPVFDGFLTSKVGSAKAAEYQFWDKLKACELLLKLNEQEKQGQGRSFGGVLEALQQGAQKLSEEEQGEEL